MPRNDLTWTIMGDRERATALAATVTDYVVAGRALDVVHTLAFGRSTDWREQVVDPDGRAWTMGRDLLAQAGDPHTAALAIELAVTGHRARVNVGADACGPDCCERGWMIMDRDTETASVVGRVKTRPGFARADAYGPGASMARNGDANRKQDGSGASVYRASGLGNDGARFMAKVALATFRLPPRLGSGNTRDASAFYVATTGLSRDPDDSLPRLTAGVNDVPWLGNALALACHAAATALGIPPIPHGEGAFTWPTELGDWEAPSRVGTPDGETPTHAHQVTDESVPSWWGNDREREHTRALADALAHALEDAPVGDGDWDGDAAEIELLDGDALDGDAVNGDADPYAL